MKTGLSLRVSQHLSLTPQLQQSIRLLQLSTLELAQEVEQMLADNPFLEHDEEEGEAPPPSPPVTEAPAQGDENAIESEAASAEPISAEAQFDQESTPEWDDEGIWNSADAPARQPPDGDDELSAADRSAPHESLTDHLHRQALALRLSDVDSAALRFLIESLNEDGYLEDPLEELAAGLAQSEEDREELIHRFTVAVRLLQNLDPTGVGARGLAECLALQLRALAQDETTATALAICRQPLEWLAKRDVRRLAQATGAGEEQTRAAMALIARLEPRPGRRFANVERNAIVPDVIVRPLASRAREGTPRFAVQLNPDVAPRLRVHALYAQALRGGRSDGHQALQQRLQEARWFIKNIQQRFDTILRVSEAIVERQKNFFVHGELAMRPLVLRDIADELGLHESTISRVTTAKYMATPQGTYELKYFFGSGLGTETGGNASSTAVRALIKQFVAAENAAKPLSDSQIADMLKEQGIECARRTVAKYREALKIAPANLRKAL